MQIIAVKNGEALVWEVSVAAAAEEEGWSAEAREMMFRGLMQKYHLNNQATAALLGCSVPTIASYRTGRQSIPVRRLMQLRRIIEAIDHARSE